MDVVLVRWPEEDARLRQLRDTGSPRLLLLNGESAPPDSTDCLEDWIRLPADDRDVRARVAALASRADDRADRAGGRRRRAASLPGQLGRAVAGRVSARRHPRRSVRRRGRARHAGPAGVAGRRADPQRPRRAHASPPAPHRVARTRGPHRPVARVPDAGGAAESRRAVATPRVSVTSILLDILIVLVAAKVAAEIAERVGFPPVVAEILAGVVIGPSVLDLVGQSRPCRCSARSA